MTAANLALRALLELVALAALAALGWQVGSGAAAWGLAVLFPLCAAVVWGVFNVPGDPSRSGAAPVVVPGGIRLLLELVLFALAIGALLLVLGPLAAVGFAGLVVLQYALSRDRIRWLLAR